MKMCFKCKNFKEKEDFYKHPGMSDGHLNKCKKCTIKYSSENEKKLRSTPEGIEKDRKRHRDKYKRLNYLEKQKEWNLNKPWTTSSVYKGLSKKFKTKKGTELHHWCYKEEFLEDIIILSREEHKKAHTFLKLDLENKIFLTETGVFLDSKEKHIQYLLYKGIKFNLTTAS